MCLDTWKKYKKVVEEERWAWKWMYQYDGALCAGYVGCEIPTGTWSRAHCSANPYGPGFHVYVERQSRRDMPLYMHVLSKMVRVKVRGIHTYGKQDGAWCWVANELFVPVPRKLGESKKAKQVKKQKKKRVKKAKAV